MCCKPTDMRSRGNNSKKNIRLGGAAAAAKVHPHVDVPPASSAAAAPLKTTPPATVAMDAAAHATHPFVLRYREELAQRRSRHGSSPHPAIAETLNALALVHHRMMGDPSTALRYHGEALGVLRECASLASMGDAACEDAACDGGRASEGERSDEGEYVAALRFQSAMTLSDLGDAYYTLGRYRSASESYREAMEGYRTAGVGEGHPRVLSTANRLERLRWRGDAEAGAGSAAAATAAAAGCRGGECARRGTVVAKGA